MTGSKIRWGIMGPGSIARKFAADLQYSAQAEIVAVASRTQGRAESFAQEFRIPQVYHRYEELVEDKEVDIVYIGTLHPQHKDSALLCLKAGKAILCEKPFAMDAREAEEMIRAAREHRTFAMEAMWTRYLPHIVQTRKWIEEGQIGEVKSLTANLGFDIGWNPGHRVLDKKLGGGALLDVGIYPISFASMIFGGQPYRMASSAHIGETGADEHFSVLFEYPGGQTALLGAGVRLALSNDAFVYGTKGYIHLPNFHSGKSALLYRADQIAIEFKDHRKSNGYIFEAEEAMNCLREGHMESQIMPLDETLEIMKTLDALRKQWGLEYT